RAGEIEQDKLVVRFRFRLGCIEIGQPVDLGRGETGGNENYRTEEKQFRHVTSFRHRSGLCKSTVPEERWRPGAGKRRAFTRRSPDMSGDELGHLEHTNLTLAVKYRLECIVRVAHRSFLSILSTACLDAVPQSFREPGALHWTRANDAREVIIWRCVAHPSAS